MVTTRIIAEAIQRADAIGDIGGLVAIVGDR